MNKYLLLIFLLGTTYLAGCVAPPVMPESQPEKHNLLNNDRKLTILANLSPPIVDKVHLGVTKGEGAAGGASYAAIEGIAQLGPVGVIFLPIFMVGGAIVGTASGYSYDDLSNAEERAKQILNSGYLQKYIQQHITNYGQQYLGMQITSDSSDLLLEINIQRIALKYSLEIDVHAKLIDLTNQKLIEQKTFRYTSGDRKFIDYMALNLNEFENTVHYALKRLGEDIVDELFLIYYSRNIPEINLEKTAEGSNKREVPLYVLTPVYPEPVSCFICGEHPFSKRPKASFLRGEFIEVDDLEPTFKWKKFPREFELNEFKVNKNEISEISYEIKIFDATPS